MVLSDPYSMYEAERIMRMLQKSKDIDDKIDGWETMTEDEDRIAYEERQTLTIVAQMLDHNPPLLTPAGLDYCDEMLARSEEWINEKLEEQNNG